MKYSSKCSDEECAGERPALGAPDDGEGEPVRGDEGVQQRHRRDAPDRRRLLRGPLEPAQAPATGVHYLIRRDAPGAAATQNRRDRAATTSRGRSLAASVLVRVRRLAAGA